MQTFLPYPDFKECAECLDRQRLGKQRVEALTILRILAEEVRPLGLPPLPIGLVPGPSYRRHPAVLMWCGYEPALADYLQQMRSEWIRRGYQDSLGDEHEALAERLMSKSMVAEYWTSRPSWLGDMRLHANHQARLIAKKPEWYSQEFGGLTPEYYNLWPVTTAGPWMYCMDDKMVPYNDVHCGQSHRGLVQAAP